MNSVEKLMYIRQLEREKTKIEQQLISTCNNIQEQKNTCLHIGVHLGYYGDYSNRCEKYRCLICGKEESTHVFYTAGHIVHAEYYLPQYNISYEKQANKKFILIQTLALGLLRENPNMIREELTEKLNNLIKESISLSEENNGPKLVKTINTKNKI